MLGVELVEQNRRPEPSWPHGRTARTRPAAVAIEVAKDQNVHVPIPVGVQRIHVIAARLLRSGWTAQRDHTRHVPKGTVPSIDEHMPTAIWSRATTDQQLGHYDVTALIGEGGMGESETCGAADRAQLDRFLASVMPSPIGINESETRGSTCNAWLKSRIATVSSSQTL